MKIDKTITPNKQQAVGVQVKPIVMCDHGTDVYSNGRFKMQRETGETPNGNKMNNKWVLRDNDKLIDFDTYRNDIAERNNIVLKDT